MRKPPFIHIGILFAFIMNMLGPMPLVQAQEFHLPVPGVMVHLSPAFNPPILKGIKVHPDNPFRFDFILDKGDSELSNGQIKDESSKLIKYFLASLTVPEKNLWVNLSPYEKDRIIPKSFGLTEMGRDLLAEDYMLKQITASLIYPEDEIGRRFWKRIYEEAYKKFGTTNIPVNTFNKVWIVPEKAVVYENVKAGTAYVVEAKLKVMLEQDYLALSHSVVEASAKQSKSDVNALGSRIVREIVIPELTKEVNEDKNFSQLRQVYNSLILATWYKKKIKDSILTQVYADKNKTAGVQYANSVIPAKAGIQKNDVEGIYQRYLQAFKKGVYNYIKEDIDPVTQEMMPKKYFSGGAFLSLDRTDLAMSPFQIVGRIPPGILSDKDILVQEETKGIGTDLAMRADKAEKNNQPWLITIPSETFTADKFDEHQLKRKTVAIVANLFVNEFLRKNSSKKVEEILSKIAGRAIHLDNIKKEIIINFHDQGAHKDVFKVSFLDKNNNKITFKLAMKKELNKHDISVEETSTLEILSDAGVRAIPRYGCRVDTPEGNFYIEEFIEGDTFRALKEKGSLDRDKRRQGVNAVLEVAKSLGSLPKDIHLANIIMGQDGRGAVVVDIGNRFTNLGTCLLRLVSFYGYFGQGNEKQGNKFIFGAFLDTFGYEEGMKLLEANYSYLRRVVNTAEVADATPAWKKRQRQERLEEALKKDDSVRVYRELKSFINDTRANENRNRQKVNSAMMALRPVDILRLAPQAGANIFISQELGGRMQNVPNEVLDVKQDDVQKTLFHLNVLNPITEEESHYAYDVLEEVNNSKFIMGDLPGFTTLKVPVAGILWVQYTNRLYDFLSGEKHPDVSEEGKWRLYLRPSDRTSLQLLTELVKELAVKFNGPLEFKYLSPYEPSLEQKLSDPVASRFVVNFASEEDAYEFYELLIKDPKYFHVIGIGQTLKAENLDGLAAIAQGHTQTRQVRNDAQLAVGAAAVQTPYLHTNEDWVKHIKEMEGRTGVYLGTAGGDQNFSRLARGNFNLGLIIDNNPNITKVYLQIKLALIARARNRFEYLSLLSGVEYRKTDEDKFQDQPMNVLYQEIRQRLNDALGDKKLKTAVIRRRLNNWSLVEGGFSEGMRAHAQEFWDYYSRSSFNMFTLDGENENSPESWLENEGRFIKIKKMAQEKRILAVTADWTDQEAMKGIGTHLERGNEKVSVVYVSNLHEWLQTPDAKKVMDNIHALPLAVDAIVLINHQDDNAAKKNPRNNSETELKSVQDLSIGDLSNKGDVNHAMVVQDKNGGIDLTPANMNVEVKAGSLNGGIKFHLDPAMLQQLQNTSGFVPVIINVEPLEDLSAFLGISQ